MQNYKTTNTEGKKGEGKEIQGDHEEEGGRLFSKYKRANTAQFTCFTSTSTKLQTWKQEGKAKKTKTELAASNTAANQACKL